MSRKQTLLSVATIAMFVLAACSPFVEPSPSPTPTNSQSQTQTPTREVTLYYVADTAVGFRLYPEVATVEKHGTNVVDALKGLVDDASVAADPDYVNLWNDDNAILSVTVNGSDLTVDLSTVHLNVGAAAEQKAIDQLLWTALAAKPSIARMKLLVEGQPVESLAGHVDTTHWFYPSDPYEVLSNVMIDFPRAGATIHSPVVVTGVACTFEAAVPWRLYREGKLVKSGSTMAAGGCPIRGEWSVNLGELTPGMYVFRAMELSEKDGSLVTEDSKSFIVEPS